MKTNQSKVAKAVQAVVRGGNFYDDGVSLGQDVAVTVADIAKALKTCKKPADTVALREGFIVGYQGAWAATTGKAVSYEAARRKFYRMAKMHLDPKVNRQSKANAAKAEAKQEADAKVEKIAKVMSEKDMARALLGASMFIAHWQNEAKDKDVIDRLGKLLAIVTPKAAKVIVADESDEGDNE